MSGNTIYFTGICSVNSLEPNNISIHSKMFPKIMKGLCACILGSPSKGRIPRPSQCELNLSPHTTHSASSLSDQLSCVTWMSLVLRNCFCFAYHVSSVSFSLRLGISYGRISFLVSLLPRASVLLSFKYYQRVVFFF